LIFATVGSQMPFDRMVIALEKWAQSQSPALTIVAQIGNSNLKPSSLKTVASLLPAEFREHVLAAEVVVSHAGMGVVLTALELGKPLVIMPRLGSLSETRNDHQVATAKWLADKPGIFVCMAETELGNVIELARRRSLQPARISAYASDELLGAIKTFIEGK